jgi:3-phytase
MAARVLSALVLLAACGQPAAEQPAPQIAGVTPVPALAVPAAMETMVADNPTVDADDPVLWADPADPRRALLIGADKSIGLYVHDLDGRVLQFFPAGPLNNVDIRRFPVGGRDLWLVAATERDRFSIPMWLLDPATLRLTPWGVAPTPRDFEEPYGFCMGQFGGTTYLIVNNKDGRVDAHRVTAGPDGPVVAPAHSWKLGSQTEGCVVDDTTGTLWVGEEDVGIWRMSLADPAAKPVKVAAVDKARLTDDVEGLTLMRDGGRTFLIASSQGDSTFPVWRVDGGRMDFVGRFSVGGGGIDPVTQTDGLDAWSGPIGRYPEGAIAFHDHCDGPGATDPAAAVCDGDGKQQNYKLVDWRQVKAALGIG